MDALLVVAVMVAIGWAVRPIREDDPTGRARENTPAMTQTVVPADGFPVAAFDRTLWYVPPTPVVVTPPRPPEMPRLELIGILREGDGYRAMIVDPATNEIRGVSDGDDLGITRIVSVSESRVRCEAHGVPFELSLEAP